MDRLQLDNDLATDFERGVELADNSARLDRLRQRFAVPAEETGETAPPAGQAPPPAVPSGPSGQLDPAKPAPAGGAPSASEVPGPAGGIRRAAEAAEGGAGGAAIAATLKDILSGGVESAPQIAGGLLDAANNTLNALDDLNKKGEGLGLLDTEISLPGAAEGDFLPTTAEAESVTGGLIRSTTQFLAGFAPFMRAVKGISLGSRVLQAAEAGALADLVVWDAHEERLSTWLNQVPALAPIVPDYLADNNPENETVWEGRLKQAIEGAGLGMAVDGLFHLFRYYKSARAATAAAKTAAMSGRDLAQQSAADAMRGAATADIVQPLQPGALDNLGDEAGSLFIGAPRGETMTEAVRLEKDARDLRLIGEALPPGMTPRFTKEGVSVIGADRKRVAVLERPTSVDETFLGTIGQRIDESGAVDRALASVRSRIANAAAAKAAAPVAAPDTRGQGAIFHGSPTATVAADEGHYTSRNIYGQGLYTTDALDIAEGYARRGKPKETNAGTIFQVGPKKDVPLLDMEQPVPAWLTNVDDDPLVEIALGEIGEKGTIRALYDEMRAWSRGEGYSADDVQELFALFQERAEAQGLRGLTHLGGKRTGSKEHRVSIFWRPEDIERIAPLARAAPASADPLEEMLNAARVGLGKEPALEVGRFPTISLLRSLGGVKPGSPLAQELAARDVTARRFPGLFRRTGVGAADNIPAGENPRYLDQGDGYIDPDDLIAAIDEELGGNPRLDPERQEAQFQWEEGTRNANEFRRDLEDLGVDFETMDNTAIRARLDAVDAERALIRAMDETPGAEGEGDFGGLDIDEGVAPREVWTAEQIDEARAAGVDPAIIDAHSGGPKIYINHARINSRDDVKALIQQMADEDADAINVKRRGVVSNAQTLKESADEYTRLEDLIGRRPGPMAAAEAVAARKVLTASGEQLVTLATKASGGDATAADLFAFRRAMQVHYAIQSEVIAARTETARALQSWAIPAGNSKQRADQIAELLNREGGAGDSQRLAAAIATLANNPAGLNVAVRQSLRGKLKDALFEAWINGLLSSPKTHVVNITSNMLTAFWQIPERYLAAGISNAFYAGEIPMGEAAASAFGIVQGMRDGIRLAVKGQDDQRVADLFDAFVKNEASFQPAISAEAFELSAGSAVGRAINLMGAVIRVPGKALEFEDRFFKSVNYRMALNGLAYRQASQEGLEGRQLATRMAEIMNDPPETLRLEAMDAAHVNTFTKPLGEIGQAVTRTINKIPGARLVVPFIRTPANILKYTFGRTPLAYASAAVRADLAAGGARAAQAHARVALGSMVMMTVGGYVADGVITGQGPADRDMRAAKMRTGWKPYSVKVGERWYQYNRLEPIGMLFGMGADIAEIIGQVGDQDAEQLALAGVTAFAQNLASKTWTRGVFEAIAALDPNNPVSDPAKWAIDFTGSVIPFSSFLRNVTQAIDPVLRDTRTTAEDEFAQKWVGDLPEPVAEFLTTMINQYRKNIPGLSDELPARPNLWGDPIETATGLGWVYDFLSPVGGGRDVQDIVDQTIVDNRIKLGMPDRTINGVRLTGEEYAQFVGLAGRPAKQMLDQMVLSPGFKRLSDGPDGMKADIVKSVIAKHRKQARNQMLAGNPRLRARLLDLERDKARSIMGR